MQNIFSQHPVIAASVVEQDGTTYALVQSGEGKHLLVVGDQHGFEGASQTEGGLLCPLNAHNAQAIRQRLPWLRAVPLGLRTSAGFGDRLGIATPGHKLSVEGTGVAPIFAQQSVRENTRTGRTPQQVMDDAMWGVLESGWHEAWGADADHLKNLNDIEPFVKAGYTFFTIDPGDYVNDAAETASLAELAALLEKLPWDVLQGSPADLKQRYAGISLPVIEGAPLVFDETALLRAAVKYGGAVAHTVQMSRRISELMGGKTFDLEMSVDETATTTAIQEHFFIANELKRLGVQWVSLAPRFVGRFEKGVDYIGDLAELDQNIAGHAAIMHYFGDTYKLSLHTGSDKFGVYPIAVKHTGGLVHLKTAGTSYLEGLRVIAKLDPAFFREIMRFAYDRYETDKVSYHVSADLAKVPEESTLTDAKLPDLLNQFDARQVLHVTFGSVLNDFGVRLHKVLREHEAEYHQTVKAHFDKHLEAFRIS